MTTYRLSGGTILDPKHRRNEIADLWFRDGRIISAPANVPPDLVNVDVTGTVLLPGGIDMHCHIAGSKVNHARQFLAGSAGRRRYSAKLRESPIVPSCIATGKLFAALGYTTAIDAAIPGLTARLAHCEFSRTPLIDKGFLSLFGNNHYILDHIRTGNQEAINAYVSWMMSAVHAYGVKIVNPGGVENWKQETRRALSSLDEKTEHFGVTPRQILNSLSTAVDHLALPHPLHIHSNNLGYPGNARITLETMQALQGQRAHFAHIQFHSYGGNPNDPGSFASEVEPLVEYVVQHPELTVDVGHILPGEAMTITGDAPFAEHLRRLTGGKWFTSDTEQEASCGVIPGKFRPYRQLVHAVQWAIGLEWYLRMPDPWRIAMSSDHPNGGAFARYPEMIHLLMDASFRQAMLARMPESLRERSALAEISREYTLEEIAIITRAAPARILGMVDRGHLGPGAVADITILQPDENITAMFQRPRFVYKAGKLIAEDGELKSDQSLTGKLLSTSVEVLTGFDQERADWFNDHYSLRYGNYRIHADDSPCQLLPLH